MVASPTRPRPYRVRCAVCGESLDPEHPDSIHQRNPLTFRVAWMHYFCAEMAFEQIDGQTASSPMYKDRLDEYNCKFG